MRLLGSPQSHVETGTTTRSAAPVYEVGHGQVSVDPSDRRLRLQLVLRNRNLAAW